MTQKQALKVLQSGHNVFLTGSAGTGKTFLLNKFIDHLKKSKKDVGVTASTGIAATHLAGRTIHSWAGIGIEKKLSKDEIKNRSMNTKIKNRIRKAEILIIDEISMLDAMRLDLVDKMCRAVKNPAASFGGMQVVLCGDFFQLPPVEREALFAYESSAWNESNIRICYLDEQFRQEDKRFTEVLNNIRDNQASEDDLELLKTRLNKSIEQVTRPTKLYAHNADVDAINAHELAQLSSKPRAYYMQECGPMDLVNMLKRSCLAPEKLELKVGAIVIFVKNNFNAGYVNGTLGKVVGFKKGHPIIETRDRNKILAVPDKWNIEEGGEIMAYIEQIPLRLAWAITIHKSQGMSLDVAEIDLSKSFTSGMGYVALSRVRTLDGIRLMGINQLALRVDDRVVIKDKEFREASNKSIK